MEESAEAPPAADEARRFRGSVPTAGRGSGWELVDTAVSAEEHAKKITTQMGGDLCDFPPLLLSVNQLFLSCVSDNAQKTMYFNYLFSAASSCKIL